MDHAKVLLAPPEAPETVPVLRISLAQKLGLPVLMLIPLLALAGTFGESYQTRELRSGPLSVAVRAPTRFRYRQRVTLSVGITNRGTSPLLGGALHIDSTYLNGFSSVALSPMADARGVVALPMLSPGGSARVSATIEGERVGVIQGTLTVSDSAGDSVRVGLQSLVFP